MKTPFDHFNAGEDLYTRIVAPVCQKHNLTYMEFTILMFLHNNPQYDTASQIVKLRRLTKSHVSTSIHSLQKRGLLCCSYRGHDRKTIHLILSDTSESIIADGICAQKKFTEIIFYGFSQEEKKLLIQFMERVDRNIDKQVMTLTTGV